MKTVKLAIVIAVVLFLCSCNNTNENSNAKSTTQSYEKNQGFTPLFNGDNLDDWIVKIHKYDVGEDPDNTFRIHNNSIRVSYDNYKGLFDDRFSHLYHKQAYDNFHLRLEYRFYGEFYPGAPYFAELNSGLMFYSQNPRDILKNQNWPISVEMQFLAQLKQGEARPTGNVCTPGTDISISGEIAKPHCVQSSSPTFPKDEWVKAELIVNMGKITQIINGKVVLEYEQPQIGFTTAVKGIDKSLWEHGSLLTKGYIALQSEGQPIDFRNIEIKEL